MASGINGRALAVTGIGALFVWSGIKGWSVLGTIGDLVTGNQPNQLVSTPLAIVSSAGAVGRGESAGSATGLAAIGLQYIGHAYRFGGAPGKNGENPWDCSSFVNYVVAVKGGLAIPGNGAGKYTGAVHGPPTGAWATWSGMQTIKRSEVQAGDIVVWLGHMGLAISNTEVVNALNSQSKTRVSNIDSVHARGPIVRCGRLGI
jgi:hypothetical protein